MATFKTFDTDGNGNLDMDEFVDGLMTVPGIDMFKVEGQPLTRDGALRLSRYIDALGDRDGTINYMEFVRALSVDDEVALGDIGECLVEGMTTTLLLNCSVVKAGCHFFDP